MLGSRSKLQNNETCKNFMSGVFILTISTVMVKIIGLVYKIPMLKLIGSEGMGYFNSAYEIYTLFCVIATAGLPVAMSLMISSDRATGAGRTRKIFSVALTLFIVMGVLGTFIIAGFAKPFSEFLHSEKSYYCIIAISPTVLLICISSAVRGYFQGREKMFPTAISQIIEALGKLILGLVFAMAALHAGYPTEIVAAFAVLGLTLGTAVSVLYLIFSKKLSNKSDKAEFVNINHNSKDIFLELLKTAIPVTMGSVVISITKIIDMTMIFRRLGEIGYNSTGVNEVYGSYTTLAVPLFSLAPAFITAVALPLVPALSGAISSNQKEEQEGIIKNAFSITLAISTPIAMGLCIYSEKILQLIFHGEDQAIATATPLMSLLGLSVVLSCMITVSNAVLQAYRRAMIPIISMACGAGVKIILAYFLIGNREINIAGAPISTFFCNFTIIVINLYFIGKYSKKSIEVYSIFIKPFFASLASVGGSYLLLVYMENQLFQSRMFTLIAIIIAALVYFILALFMGIISKQQLGTIPFGNKILKIIYRR